MVRNIRIPRMAFVSRASVSFVTAASADRQRQDAEPQQQQQQQ